MPNRNRKNQIHLFLNDDELDVLEYKVEMSGLNDKSSFLRRMIKYGFNLNVDYSELSEYNRKLGGMATNLNQIAHNTNIDHHASIEEIKEAKEIMKEVWQLQQSILSKLEFKDQ